MKKILYSILTSAMLCTATSCNDFLDVSSPSEADVDFVFSEASTARAALYNAYELWRGKAFVHSNGLFYDLVVVGSDAERHPEGYTSQIARHVPENLYGYSDASFTAKGTANYSISSYSNSLSAWDAVYAIIATTNTLINAVESSSSFAGFATQDGPSELSQIYGEAVALRATCYHELIRFFGDVPHQLVSGENATEITSRDVIAEYHINKLRSVVNLMFRAGESSGIDKSFMNRTYAEGLIGRMALMEGGYQTRRNDIVYKNLNGDLITFDKVAETPANNCFYGRRKDWESFYKIAETYLSAAVSNSGTISLQVNDPRSDANKTFGNPFQYVFQQMMDMKFADENVYEIPETRGGGSERPYAFGRPSSGGSSSAYPCKNYGQSRFHPIYYYGDFEPNDMRRDVTCAVTGSTGDGSERIIPLGMGNVANNGGIALNKWDECRQTTPWTIGQRKSGINVPYMRFSDLILMLAEVKAVLGDNVLAKQYLLRVRSRAFGSDSAANVDAFIAKCGSVLDAILEERKLEFGGEGIRRYDLIRNNKLGSALEAFHSRTGSMIADLKTQGYHRFDNGNVIPAYIWWKKVDPADFGVSHRLTTTCTDNSNPVLFPGWRGQNDDWNAIAAANGSSTSNLKAGSITNLAIKGLFEYIDPNGTEAASLEAEGYTKQEWGAKIVELEKEYNDYVFNGYSNSEAPVYLIPYHPNTIRHSNGILNNGYGFKNE